MKIDKFSGIDKNTIDKLIRLRDSLTEEQTNLPISLGNTKNMWSNLHILGEEFCFERSEIYALEHEGFIKIVSNQGVVSSTDNHWGCLVELTLKAIKFKEYKKEWILNNRKGRIVSLISILISIATLIVSIIGILQ